MMNDIENSALAAPPPPEPMFEMTTQGQSTSGISVDDENPGLDRGHSLPNVDELKTDHRAKSLEFVSEDGQVTKRRGGWVVWVALVLALVVIGVIVAVAVTVTNEEDNRSSSSASAQFTSAPGPPLIDQRPTDDGKETGGDVATPRPATVVPAVPPTVAPNTQAPVDDAEKRFSDIKSFIINQEISTETDLNTQGSAQQRALNWIANIDTAPVPAGDKSTPEGYDFTTRYVLAVLFYGSFGDQWVYSLNFLKPFSVCYWYSQLLYPDLREEFRGVACTNSGQIAALFMTRMRMEGSLPAELSQLTTLVAVDFNFNLFNKALPSSYQNLVNMQNFFIMSNRLTGTVPAWLDKMVSLRNINLSHNLLTGRLPTTMGNLRNAKGIAFDNNLLTNNLDGVFDTNMVPGFRKLEQLYLENNYFTGTLSEDFGALANFTHLDISDNSFRGPIPNHLFELTNLKVLDLHDNEFATFPNSFPPNSNLELLALQKNRFENQKLPTTISRLSALQHFDVSQNKLTGAIPTEIGTLSNMTYLFFAENDFSTGDIPFWVEDLKKLEELSFKSTQRTGPIPTYLGTLSKLVLLDLDDNKLTGTIPENLGTLTDLHVLLLNRNNLTSTIPTSFASLRSLKLFFVDTNNKISGDLDQLYCTNPSFLLKPVLVADCTLCDAAIDGCCTTCCIPGQECNPGIHVPDLDPIWQLSYQRVFFTFGREDYYDKDAKEGLSLVPPGS